jgi:hypothetical protein
VSRPLRSTWSIIIMREIIKARATCSSFLLSAKTQNMKARFGIVNGLEASSNTTSAKPHEFFQIPPDLVVKFQAIDIVEVI